MSRRSVVSSTVRPCPKVDQLHLTSLLNAMFASKALRDRIGAAGLAVVETLVEFLEPKEPHELRLHLLKQPPPQKSSDAKSPWAKSNPRPKKADEFDPDKLDINPDLTPIRELLPGVGRKGHLLRSLESLDYPFFHHLHGEMFIQANAMFDRKKQIDAAVPHPMAPMLVEYVFASIEEAAIQFAMHAHNSHHEQKEQLTMWEQRSHYGLVYNVDGIAVVALKFRDFRKLASFEYESTFRLLEYSKIQMEFQTNRLDKTGKNFTLKLLGFVPGAPLGDFLHADAYIIVTNKSLASTRDPQYDCCKVFSRELQRVESEELHVVPLPEFHQSLETLS